MHKRNITYEDGDGKVQTEVFYFNITRVEFTRWIANHPDLDAMLTQAVQSEDSQVMFNIFEDLVLMSYGERQLDAKGFTKNAELLEKFKSSFAYDALFTELSDVDGALNLFFKGILPKGVEIDLSPQNIQSTLETMKGIKDEAEVQGVQIVPLPPSPEPRE